MTRGRLTLIKALVILSSGLPLVLLAARGFGYGNLGANPIQEILHTLGKTGLNLLLITLAITPLRKLTGLKWLTALRRVLGLAVFAYVLLHATTYVALDLQLVWPIFFADVTQRPYITVGVAALILLVPLAITSTNSMQRKLGKRWQKLHRLIYVISILGIIHFFWQVKITTVEPLIYTFVLIVLLSFRAKDWLSRFFQRTAVNKS